MNKKLRLLGYVFSHYKVDDFYFSKMVAADYLIKEDSVYDGINVIGDILEEDYANESVDYGSTSFSGTTSSVGSVIISGDTVSNQISFTNGAMTLGTTTLNEGDLIKIKKVANIT